MKHINIFKDDPISNHLQSLFKSTANANQGKSLKAFTLEKKLGELWWANRKLKILSEKMYGNISSRFLQTGFEDYKNVQKKQMFRICDSFNILEFKRQAFYNEKMASLIHQVETFIEGKMNGKQKDRGLIELSIKILRLEISNCEIMCYCAAPNNEDIFQLSQMTLMENQSMYHWLKNAFIYFKE